MQNGAFGILLVYHGCYSDVSSPSNQSIMNEEILALQLFDFQVIITAWKLIGYLGVFLFGSRWIIQLISTSRHGKPNFPILFWILSLCGSFLTLSYFIFGKNDSVGILANLFPASVATYNLFLEIRWRKSQKAEDS